MTKTPTTIITGFLGAGKTTIILHLVEQLQQQGEKVAYIKNEVGDATIDTELVLGQFIATKELLNGCICCTLTGPFLHAIDELIEQAHPDRILIEASGTADVAALALSVSSHPRLYRDGVLSIIDVVNFEGFADLSITAQNQTQLTDLIVFNKVELVDDLRKRAVVGYVRELNTHSPIIEAPEGKLNTSVVFGISTRELEHLLQQTADRPHTAHDHLAQDHIDALSLPFSEPVDISELKQRLQQLPESVFRVKGIVRDKNGQSWLVQKVAHRTEITLFEELDTPITPQLIFIGFEITHLELQLRKSLLQ